MARKVILDVDTGIDDAMALLLALNSPELEVIGVTCVGGNTTLDHVVRNTLDVLALAGRTDIPVAVGARKPLMDTLHTATYFHGPNGLGGVTLPPSPQIPVPEDATTFLTRLVTQHRGQVTVVAVGPLTNVALAVLRDAAFASNLECLIIMGGSIGNLGNATSAAEANFHNDPEAATAVLRSGAHPGLVDLGATHRTLLSLSGLPAPDDSILSPVARFVRQILEFYERAYLSTGIHGVVLHDPLAVALTAQPDLGRFVPVDVEVETSGTLTRGASVASFSPEVGVRRLVDGHWDVVGLEERPFNATVARDIDVSAFHAMFLQRLGLTS